jgi:hypothetical protein
MFTRSGKAVRRSKFVAIALLALLSGCAAQPPTASVAIPTLAPGMARAWFYREDTPYNGLDRPYVRMNGAVVGIAELGGAFYRNVAPGPYYVTVDSWGTDVGQFPHVYLTAGETLYFQVIESLYWASGSASTNWTRPTFYVWVMPAGLAGPQIARTHFYPNAD